MVFVTWVNFAVMRLKINISGLGFEPVSTFPPATISRVEVNAMIFPSSLICASRLSSAMKGATLAEPGDGARLAGVLVIRVNVPALKSANGTSAPLESVAVSATVNEYVHIS